MARLRVYRSSLTDGPPGGRVRVYRADVTGVAPIYGKVRVYRASTAGTAAVIVAPMTGVTAGPGEAVSFTADLVGGASGGSTWVWRRVSGPAVTLGQSGATVTVAAPSVMPPGDSLVLGVTATLGGVTSTERQVTVTVLPQTRWTRAPGGQWVGAVTAPA